MHQTEFRHWITESLGTFLLVFSGCGSIMVAERFPGSVAPWVVPLVFGLIVASLVYSFGHLSGAHFNPAVTIAFSVGRYFPWSRVPGYCVAQTIGALAAIGVLHILLPQGLRYGSTVPTGVALWQAFGWEFILTFFLMFVVVSVATDARAEGSMAGVAIGAAVALDAFVGGPVTGASMNPARSFAPALFEGRLEVVWIYLTAPIAGAVTATLGYGWLRAQEPSPT